jgi:hypothetical protein
VLNKPLNLQMFLAAFELFLGRVSIGVDEGGEEDAVQVLFHKIYLISVGTNNCAALLFFIIHSTRMFIHK